MSSSQKTITPPVPGTPVRILPTAMEEDLTASGPESGAQDEFGPGDVLQNPFGGYGANRFAPGHSLVPGFPPPPLGRDWDERSSLTQGSTAPASSPNASGSESMGGTVKRLKKKLSKIWTGKDKEERLPDVESAPGYKRLSDPTAQNIFQRLTGSSPPSRTVSEKDLAGSRFATRGPPQGKRTSALASPRSSGEPKKTGEGPLPVGAPTVSDWEMMAQRVEQLELQVVDLRGELNAIRVQREQEKKKERQDREATNRLIAQMRANIQDAVGADFRVPVPSVFLDPVAPPSAAPVPARSNAPAETFSRAPKF